MHIETGGSMIFTREEGWKEIKVGRIFKSGDCIRNDGKLGWITHSSICPIWEIVGHSVSGWRI